MTFIDVLTRISVSKVISSALGVGVFPPHVEAAVGALGFVGIVMRLFCKHKMQKKTVQEQRRMAAETRYHHSSHVMDFDALLNLR